jgi:hypothetical protein
VQLLADLGDVDMSSLTPAEQRTLRRARLVAAHAAAATRAQGEKMRQERIRVRRRRRNKAARQSRRRNR